MNETIKTYTEITPLDGLKLSVANDGKPVEGLVFKREIKGTWRSGSLEYVAPSHAEPFKTGNAPALYCAKVTELDPCKSPDGCHGLELWLAYVGLGKDIPESEGQYYVAAYLWAGGKYATTSPSNDSSHYAIDVRTAWAQEHFPEHCRIRNYQEPKTVIDRFIDEHKRIQRTDFFTESDIRDAHELGQANPNPTLDTIP